MRQRTVDIDPIVAPIISKLFELYANSQYSVREATVKGREWGLVHRKSGTKVPASTVNKADTVVAQSAAAKCAIWSACAFTKDGRAVARAT
ncbi:MULTISPECIES: hypothetical protein [unclassified Nitrosospira]|uniref:hypothetical protein n=1 Tax=unclassified Nitrosospira TaxID=2609267 RepID=UPI0015E64FB6|nr:MULTISPECIES: hypothetical protein [unclassified Nitrosospira]WON74138.1 hypothetical protein R5L00_01220 [Nitrosospira sp. Is2]